MSDLNKNNPFKTPDAYFENLTDRVLDNVGKDKGALPEREGFAVPKDYFKGLHEHIQEKLDPQETKVVQLNPFRKYYFAAAAVAAVVLIVFGLNWKSTPEFTFDELADSEIETYFDANEYGLSSYEIAEVLDIDELQINDILENQFEEENLIDYLNDHIDDFEELNTEDYE